MADNGLGYVRTLNQIVARGLLDGADGGFSDVGEKAGTIGRRRRFFLALANKAGISADCCRKFASWH